MIGPPGRPLLSIVLPVFNEAGSIDALYRRINAVCKQREFSFEIIFVDDGSTDESRETIARLAGASPGVRAIFLSRNFGHQAALTAGIDHATGNAVIVMDADLQHPPEIIPKMVDDWQGGAEVVSAVRQGAQTKSLLKNLTSRAYYALLRRMSALSVPQGAADFRLYGPRAVAALRSIREQARFMRGISNWIGFRQSVVPYRADERQSGAPKYTLRKQLGLALDGLFSFSVLPLRVVGLVGLVTLLIDLGYAIYVLYARIAGLPGVVPGWASLALLVGFLAGIQLLTIGVTNEYIARIYDEVKRRPLYIVEREIGSRTPPGKSDSHELPGGTSTS